MADESEIDRLDSQPVEVKLSSGFPVEVVRLRTRQLFRLMRIITRGTTPQAIAQLNFSDTDTEDGQAKFAAQLLSIVVMAIPDAEIETIGFLQSMVNPAGVIDKPPAKLTKQQNEQNEALRQRYAEEMFNPDIEDTINLLEVIITNEAPDIQALGKKLSHLWQVARKSVPSSALSPEEIPQATDLP